ncbi:ERMIN protein, partial [Rhinopomastus cyanomelas]|nr:ERMIN protein [Rhinopomastus cyanomelas]
MTDEVLSVPSMPECNGSAALGKGSLQVIDAVGEMAKPAGPAPYANADTSPDLSPENEHREENRNSLAGAVVRGDLDGEKQSAEKPEESDGPLQQGSADTQDLGTDGQELEEGSGEQGLGTTGSPSGETPTASADGQGNATEEEEEEVEEEDTEEDEVQVIEIKKESSEGSHLQQPDSGKEAPTPATPGCNSPLEKAGEQPSLGKKNDISRHSYSRYNTISYRRIRKGNTKQRIDEFESMMHL